MRSASPCRHQPDGFRAADPWHRTDPEEAYLYRPGSPITAIARTSTAKSAHLLRATAFRSMGSASRCIRVSLRRPSPIFRERIAFTHVDCAWYDPVTYCLNSIADPHCAQRRHHPL
jgi:hypothetical protein